MGKGKRQPSPSNPALQRGPTRNPTIGGRRYFLTIVDDFSQYCDITIMRNKHKAFDALKSFIDQAETQLEKRVEEVRTDGGGEFKSQMADQKGKGIIHTVTPPDAHALNG